MIESPSDYYAILGVSCGDSAEKIKNAFRKLALKFHPDVNTDTAGHLSFILLKNAFDILIDPEKRKEYDEYLKNSSLFRETLRSDIRSGKKQIDDGRQGREAILQYFNYILWEIEDLLFYKRRSRGIDEKTLTDILFELLKSIDNSILEPAGKKDYFFEARRMPPGSANIFGSGDHHAPYVNINHYFYNIRMRANDLIENERLIDFSQSNAATGKNLIENILDIYNRVIRTCAGFQR